MSTTTGAQDKTVSTDLREIRILSAVGMREVIKEIAPEFEKKSGYTLSAEFSSGAMIEKRLAAGEKFDIVFLPRTWVDRLSKANKLNAISTTDVASSIVGVAVRADARKPDISSSEAFKDAMLNARSIAMPDPAMGGSSGVHIAKVFEQLGIDKALRSKLILVSTPDQPLTMPGYIVAEGRAEIALHQMQELMAVPGIDIVGPLPKELAGTFLFSAVIMTGANQKKAARSFIKFLRTSEAKVLIKTKGMLPAYP